MPRPQREEIFDGLPVTARKRHLCAGVFLVQRDGMVLVETDSPREARILAFKRGEGAFATDYRGVLLGPGRGQNGA